ncbi:MAG: DPP IV N-terminal domain-containing protein [Acidobacteriota bacterium]|jgi:Tol biopolymer transport system component
MNRIVVFGALIGGALLLATSPGHAGRPQDRRSWSLTAGSIVFESHASGQVNIHRYDAGAPRPVTLTSHRARDQRPRWSPDGTRVAFHSDLRGNNDVYVIDADGGNLQRITDHPGDDSDPDWMPDGRLLFSSDRSGDQNIWLLDLQSGDLRQLTHYDGGRTGGPTAAGDGRRIAFSSDRRFSWQVYVLDLAGGAIERITGPLPGRCNPAWNPAGERIAYMAGGDLVGTDLRSILADGGDALDLASAAGDNQDPQFSQDGRRLVWVTDRHDNWEIYEADADGRNERRVSTTPRDERHPDLFVQRVATSGNGVRNR